MTFDPEALSGDAEFLQRLAQQLIPDRQAAEDASQEVALAYLRKRPGGLRSARAWMVGALRLERLRWLERRGRHSEESSTPEEATDDRLPRQDVASSELFEMIAREARALREPYRAVVWASLFEEEPLDSIARRLGRPSSTVRSQRMRGLEILRSRLDDRLGSRGAWALLLLAGPKATSPTRPLEVVSRTATGARRLAGLLALPLVTVGVWLWLQEPSRSSGTNEEDASQVAAREAAPESRSAALARDLEDRGGSQEPETRSATDGGASKALAVVADVEPAARSLRARVIDSNGVGVPGATIYTTDVGGMATFENPVDSNEAVRRDLGVTNARGEAVVRVPVDMVRVDPSGLLRSNLYVEAVGFAASYQYTVDWSTDPEQDELRSDCLLLLTPDAIDVRLRVIDDQGAPVSDAELVVMLDSARWQQPRANGLSTHPVTYFLKSERPGLIRVPPIVPGRYVIFAWADGRGLSQHVLDLRDSGTVDLQPTATHLIRGRVLDGQGAPLEGVAVWETRTSYEDLVPLRWRSTRSGFEGLYELKVQRFDRLELWAGDPEDEGTCVRRPLDLDQVAKDGVDLVLSHDPPVRIRLVDENGHPLADWAAILYSKDETNIGRVKGLSDSEGRLSFTAAAGSSLTLCVYGPLPDIPPARLTIRDLEPIDGERVVVAPTRDFEYSAILGMISTPGWEPPADFMLSLAEPGLLTATWTSIGRSGEPFALEHVGRGRVHLSIMCPPTLFKEIGVVDVPNGSFFDMGEIVLEPPGRVSFATTYQVGFEAQVAVFRVEFMTGEGVVVLDTVQGWPERPFELLAGEYRATMVDRTGTEYYGDFSVAPGAEIVVPLLR